MEFKGDLHILEESKKVLSMIENEGLENRWERHVEMSNVKQNWAFNHGQKLFPEDGCASYTLTCVENVNNWDIHKMYEKLLQKWVLRTK